MPAIKSTDSHETHEPVCYLENGFDDAVPCLDTPDEDAFTCKLLVLLTRKDVPRGLLAKVMKVTNNGMALGILDRKQSSFHVSREATFNRLQALFPSPKHESVPMTLESCGNKCGTTDVDTTL